MDASDITDHISRRFNKDLEDLRNHVLAMGGLVEQQLSLAISAIVSGDSELGLKVAEDDYKVNNFEEADLENINIKFTTIQQLHYDLNNTKENSVTCRVRRENLTGR